MILPDDEWLRCNACVVDTCRAVLLSRMGGIARCRHRCMVERTYSTQYRRHRHHQRARVCAYDPDRYTQPMVRSAEHAYCVRRHVCRVLLSASSTCIVDAPPTPPTPSSQRPATEHQPPRSARTVPYTYSSVHNLPRRNMLVRARDERPMAGRTGRYRWCTRPVPERREAAAAAARDAGTAVAKPADGARAARADQKAHRGHAECVESCNRTESELR